MIPGRRDSTGGHLAVVWLGRDDKETGFYGSDRRDAAVGRLVREAAERAAATRSRQSGGALDRSATQRATSAECEGARALLFIHGYEPTDHMDCDRWTRSMTAFRNRVLHREPPSADGQWNDDDEPDPVDWRL
ncbi:MAG: hypothetical protein IPP28_07240 [Xanthomonadales bacterium]|nr:hypothetical protein [Xanthomonadales bacterium]